MKSPIRNTRALINLFMALIAVLVTVPAFGQSISFQDGVASYSGTRDTYIWNNSPTTSRATEATIVQDYDSGTNERRSLLQFDLSSTPSGVTVTSAELQFYVTAEGKGFNMHRMLASWLETDTYNTLVGGVNPDDTEAESAVNIAWADGTSLDGNGDVIPTIDGYINGFIRLTVPVGTIQAWIDGTLPNNGWLMVSTDIPGGDGQQLASREATTVANHPKLTINYTSATTYTVAYDGNGNTGGTAPVDGSSPYTSGATVTVLGAGDLAKTGSTFAGWNTQAGGGGTAYAAAATFNITENTTLYAQWTPETYTVTYDGNTNTGGTAPVDGSSPHTSGATVTVLGMGTLNKTGNIFTSWNTAANGSGTSYVQGGTFNITDNTTLYAQWDVPTVSFQDDVSYTGTRDTYFRNSDPDTDHGSDATIIQDYDSPTNERRSLLQFDMTTIPAGSTVTSAVLQFYVTTEGEGFNMHRMLAPWLESSTYSTLGGGVDPDGVEAASAVDANWLGELNYVGYITVTVPVATIQGWIDAPATNNGWLMVPTDIAGGNGQQLASRENGTAAWHPKLSINYTAATTYMVTYNGNTNTGGTAPVDGGSPYVSGATVTVLGAGDLLKTGNTFNGWNTQADGGGTAYAVSDAFTISNNTTLFAQWTPVVTYTVAYDGNTNDGGSVPVDSGSPYTSGATVTVLGAGDLAKTGNTFAGWNTQAGGGGTAYAAAATFNITENTTLYAQWTPETYTVTYDGNTNTGGTAPVDIGSPYTSGASVQVLGTGTLNKTGNDFTGWNTAANGSGTSYSQGNTFNITGNTTLYAQWDVPTVSFQDNVSYTGTLDTYIWDNNPTTSYGTATTLIQDINPSDERRSLLKFDLASIPAGSAVTSAVLQFYVTTEGEGFAMHRMLAAWDESSTYTSLGGGVDPDDVEAASAVDGNWPGELNYVGYITVTVPAATIQGWIDAPATNNGWLMVGTHPSNGQQLASRENSTLEWHPKLSINYTAATTYTVTYDGNTNTGGTAPVDGSSPYTSGATVTVLGAGDLLKTGNTFNGWNTQADGGGTSYAVSDTFTISNNTTLFAQWTPVITYTVAYDGNTNTGGTVPVDGSSPYTSGATVNVQGAGTLTKTGNTFAGWNTQAGGGGTAYAASDTFTITSNTTLFAQWTPVITYTVTYDGNTNDGGTAPVDGSSPYISGATVNVLGAGSLSKSGNTFNGWNTQAGGGGISYAASDIFTITSNTTLYAQWNAVVLPGDDFTIVAIPDTQHLVDGTPGSNPAAFAAQMQWIVDNKESRNIVFVTGLGDIVQNGDNSGNNSEWLIASGAYGLLENPATTTLPDGIPFGLSVGNHDQSPIGDAAGTTTFFNQYFGVPHFSGRVYYGGNYGSNNDNSYQLFSAGGMDFIIFHFEYDTSMDQAVLDWADALLATYSDRKAIITTHYMVGTGNPASFGTQGQAIYNALSDNENVFLTLGGHVNGEGRRSDTGSNGNIIYSVESDYQDDQGGGNGYMRIMTFSPANNTISVETYSPYLGTAGQDAGHTDDSSQFVLAYDFGAPATPVISVSGTPLSAFTSDPGVPSAVQSYSVSGSGLTTDITVTAPTDFEVSTSSGSGFGSSVTLPRSGGTVAATTIYVRFNRATQGITNANISNTSAGASTQNVAVSGQASNPVSNTELVLQDGLDSYSGTRDTYIYNTDPTLARGNEITFIQDNETNGEITRTSLLSFDLSSIPSGSTITSASLEFNVDTEGQGFDMFRMLQAWDEATVSYSTLGNRHYASNGTDAESTIDANWPGNDTYVGPITVTVPVSTIQDWIDGTLANNGWLMVATDLAGDGQQLSSRESATQAIRPKLTIGYIASTTDPYILVSGSSLPAFSSEPGSPSTVQSYTVSGGNLTAGIALTAPTNFEISTSSGSGFGTNLTLPQTGGSVAPTTIYVRLNRATEGVSNGTITHTSSGALTRNVTLSGNTTTPSLTDEIVLQDGLNSYAGTRDTYLYDVSPGTVRGSELTFIQDVNTGDDRTSLLKFDLAPVPTGSTITSATLEFNVDTEGQGFAMYRMLQAWDEATISFTSNGGHFAADNSDAESTLNTSWPGNDGYTGPITVTVPPSTIQDWIDGTLPNNGWLMLATHPDDGQQLSSRESASQAIRPKLTIGYIASTTDPYILVSATTLPSFDSETGTPSAVQSYTVSGGNLGADIALAAPVNFEISLNSGSGFGTVLNLVESGGTVPTTTIYVRLNRATEGISNGVISHSSPGAIARNVTLSGNTTAPSLTDEIVLQDGLNGYSGTRDTYLFDEAGNEGVVRGAELTFIQDVNTTDDRTSLLKFDLAPIPSGSIISSATLEFNVDTEGQGFNMYRMLQSWDEATISYVSNGNRHFAANGTDAESAINANWPGNDGYTGPITVSVPAATIQAWLDGTFTNNGWLMLATDSADGQQLSSRESTTQSIRPKLTVEYLSSTDPFILVSGNSLPAFNSVPGSPSAEKSYTVSGGNLTTDIALTAPADFEISTSSGSGFGPTLTLTQTGGAISATTIYVRLNRATVGTPSGNISHSSDGATTQNVAVSGVTAVPQPTITISGSLIAFNSQAGIPSATQSYTVAGSDLTADIALTAPTDFEISTTSGSGYGSAITLTQAGGSVNATTIYVRLNRATDGSSSGNISHTSAGAITKNQAVTGQTLTVLAVTGIELIDADNNVSLGALTDGMIIDINTLPTLNLTIEVFATNDVESLRLVLSGAKSQTMTENNPLYALYGNSGSNYNGSTFIVGTYSFTVTPFSGNNLTGTQGTPRTVNFELADAPPIDNDGDGYNADVDCDDNNFDVNPGATEICDGIDNNCDGQIDEGVTTTYYADTDGDGYGDPASELQSCGPVAGYVTDNTDCNDSIAEINPGAIEICDGIDNNCDGQIDEGLAPVAYYADLDGDGYGNLSDEVLSCSGPPTGYVADNTDCDDTLSAINPGAVEICDGIDNNCDGTIDEGFPGDSYYADLDGDGYGDPASVILACSMPTGYVTDNTDCDDTMAAIHPGAVEICDGIDNNCDGNIDEGIPTISYYADLDGDGFGNPSSELQSCSAPAGYVTNNTDCNDNNAAVHPGAVEICDGIDNNCNGLVDGDEPGVTCSTVLSVTGITLINAASDVALYPLTNGMVINIATLPTQNLSIEAFVTSDVGSVRMVLSGSKTKTQTENNAPLALYGNTGADYIGSNFGLGTYTITVTPYSAKYLGGTQGTPRVITFQLVAGLVDNDGDGYLNDVDCNDNNAAIHPGAPEICDGIDNNCDGQIDEGLPTSTYYADLDGDGYGNPSSATQLCGPRTGYVTNNTDCNDNNAAVHPGAVEICDGIDNNCDGLIDGADPGVSCPVALSVTSLALINANTDLSIGALTNGMVIGLNTLPTQNLTIEAFVTSDVKSIRMVLTGAKAKTQTENNAPLVLYGNTGPDYIGSLFGVGNYTITVTPYSGKNLTGSQGTPKIVSFQVVQNGPALTAKIGNTLTLSPNPASSYTEASFENPETVETIMVFDITGRLVRTYSAEDIKAGEIYTLDLNFMQPGTYIIKTTNDRGFHFQKQMIIRE